MANMGFIKRRFVCQHDHPPMSRILLTQACPTQVAGDGAGRSEFERVITFPPRA